MNKKWNPPTTGFTCAYLTSDNVDGGSWFHTLNGRSGQIGWLSGSSSGFTGAHSCSCIRLKSPRWLHWHAGQMVLAAGWGLQFPCTWPPILQQTDFLTQWPQGRGLRGWKQKLKGHLRLSLQNSYNVAPTTFYESKQVTGQPRFKRWGNRLHHLTEGATQKKLYLMYHRRSLHM